MTQIKSEKARAFIDEYQQDGFIYAEQALHAVAISESGHIKEVDELKADRDKYKGLYENNESAVETCRVAVNRLNEIHDANRWREVNEELPPQGGHLLLKRNSSFVGFGFFDKDNDFHSCTIGDDSIYSIPKSKLIFTHWKPITE